MPPRPSAERKGAETPHHATTHAQHKLCVETVWHPPDRSGPASGFRCGPAAELVRKANGARAARGEGDPPNPASEARTAATRALAYRPGRAGEGGDLNTVVHCSGERGLMRDGKGSEENKI